MNKFLSFIILLLPLVTSLTANASEKEAPKVVVSVAPVHSLVASMMRGAGEPELLLPAGISPHDYTMKPSNARSLYGADAVFWVGSGLESFLEKPLSIAASKVMVIALGEAQEGEGHEHDNEHGEDYHPWLNPLYAIKMSEKIEAALIQINPKNKDLYQRNGKALRADLTELDQQLEASLAEVKDQPYIVFHDAYGDFEARYGLNHQGAVSLSPERPTGSKHIRELRQKIKQDGIVCVFSEPQFKSSLLKILLEDNAVKTAKLDPLGQGLIEGTDLYKTLMQNLSGNLINCLKP